jgi:hypothetical protein
MEFFKIAVGQKFKFNNEEYVKIKEVKVNCCKVKENCEIINTGEKRILKPLDKVETLS